MKKTKAQPKSVEPILASMHVRCTSIQDSIIIAIRWIYVAISISLFLIVYAFIILFLNCFQLYEQKICGEENINRKENVGRSETTQQQPLILTPKIEFFRILRICLNFLNREKQFYYG
ncbi:hypothetical protein QQG55_36395 [Brugia pahangi]